MHPTRARGRATRLAAALIPADGADENAIASAARADTKGREKAIAILNVLLAQVLDDVPKRDRFLARVVR